VTAVCRGFGVSRRTYYRWRARYQEHGAAGLVDRSSRPHRSPRRLALEHERAIAELRRQRKLGSRSHSRCACRARRAQDHLYTRGLATRQHRSARVQILIRDGRHTDETLEAVWDELLTERVNGMTMLGRHLLQSEQLRDGLELAEVRDVLWTYTSVELYELLVLKRGWSLDRYAEWLGQAIIAALVQPSWLD